MAGLVFDGSVWCNVDIALRQVNIIYRQELETLGLSVVEWYILRMLYEQDGQMASRLADGVGRPATSFTPILDKLQDKGFIERRHQQVQLIEALGLAARRVMRKIAHGFARRRQRRFT